MSGQCGVCTMSTCTYFMPVCKVMVTSNGSWTLVVIETCWDVGEHAMVQGPMERAISPTG